MCPLIGKVRSAQFRKLLDQCREFGIAYFMKQLGGWPDKRGGAKAVLDGRRWTERPSVGGVGVTAGGAGGTAAPQ